MGGEGHNVAGRVTSTKTRILGTPSTTTWFPSPQGRNFTLWNNSPPWEGRAGTAGRVTNKNISKVTPSTASRSPAPRGGICALESLSRGLNSPPFGGRARRARGVKDSRKYKFLPIYPPLATQTPPQGENFNIWNQSSKSLLSFRGSP